MCILEFGEEEWGVEFIFPKFGPIFAKFEMDKENI